MTKTAILHKPIHRKLKIDYEQHETHKKRYLAHMLRTGK